MTDQEGPKKQASEGGDGWVSLEGYWSSRRVPGIDEVPETTYVKPPARISRRTLIVGSAIALASIAIGAGLVFAAGSKGGPKLGKSELSAAATLTSSSSTSSSTTTTTTTAAPTSSTTTANTTATTRAASSGGSSTPVVAATPPTPRATADAAQPPYQPVPLPAGVTATLTSCRWQLGGTLQAAGTITSTMATGHTWTMTMHWLQNSRDLAQQSGLMDLQPGEAKPWSLTISQPNPPADLACSLVIA